MPAITREEVAHLARLSRLDLSDDELAHYAEQLDVILGSVARVGEAVALLGQGQEIPPTSHSLPLVNVTRPDVVRPSLDPADVLSQAPAAQDQRFRVPRILGED
jgi:aspartyl-tRNA(Asn)/glutamyl-tRNA(Gln) amidotransferase subunit C